MVALVPALHRGMVLVAEGAGDRTYPSALAYQFRVISHTPFVRTNAYTVNLPSVHNLCDLAAMENVETIGETLARLRERSGLTLDAIARVAKYANRSSVQRYFDADYDPAHLSPKVAERLADALAGHGRPPIQRTEITSLAGAFAPEMPITLSERAAKLFVWNVARRFGAVGLDRDDPEVIRLSRFLLVLLKASAAHQAKDSDDWFQGLLAAVDAQ